MAGFFLQGVSVAQQLAGYKPDLGFTPLLITALESVDAAIGSLVAALQANQLARTTGIIIFAKHGQSPIDPSMVRS